jgi:hypothetical protein
LDRNQFKVIIGGKDNNIKNKIELKNEENRQSFKHSFQYSSIENINLNDLRFKIKNKDDIYITYYQEDFENKIELERIHPINPFFSFVINVYAPEKYTEKEYGSNLLHRVGTITGMIKTKELKTNILLYNLLEQLDNGELMMNTSEENIYDCFIDEIKIKSDFSNTELLKYLWSSLPGLIEFIYGTKVRCIVTDPINDSEKIENKIENLIIELISDLGYVKFKNSTYWGINYMQPKNIIPEF